MYYYIPHNPYDQRLIISDPVTCCLTHKPLNFLLLFLFLVHVIPVYFWCMLSSSSLHHICSFSELSIIRSISNVSFLDPQDDPQDEPSGGLSSTLVQKLPQFKTSKPARPDGSECVVCLDGFRKGRWCRRLPGCGHVFHRKCVDTWFLRADTCPTCRARVRLTEEDAQQGWLWKRWLGLG